MFLSMDEVERFFRLYWALMFYINEHLDVLPEDVASPEEYSILPPEDRYEVHLAFHQHLELIDRFVGENPFGFDEPDLDTIQSWKHLVTGRFYAFRYLKRHMIFLTTTEPIIAYGVVALADPFELLLPVGPPTLLQTTLLPFEGKIVYDGLMICHRIHFGAGIKRRLNEEYKDAKARFGVVTQLPFNPRDTQQHETTAETKKTPKSTRKSGRKRASATKDKDDPKARQALDAIVKRTDAFCRRRLDNEYAQLCRKMAEAIHKRDPAMLGRGKPESWACGIVRTIGWINFLGDPNTSPHMKMTDIDKDFEVSEATGAAKSTAIRKLLDPIRFDPDWTLPSMADKNPLIWMLEVNGRLMDIRRAPRGAQEEAYRQGLIPYIPADRNTGDKSRS